MNTIEAPPALGNQLNEYWSITVFSESLMQCTFIKSLTSSTFFIYLFMGY